MRSRLLVCLVAAFSLIACLEGIDVKRSGPGGKTKKHEGATTKAKKAFKKAKKWKEPFDAWRDAVEAIEAREERALGAAATAAIIRRSNGVFLEDVPVIEYVNEVANLVAQQGERKVMADDGKPRIAARRFWVTILNDETATALSAPGGHLFVTTGLLESLGSESELAFVLGHEIAHIDFEHGLTSLKIKTGAPAALASALDNIKLGDAEGMDVGEFFRQAGVFNGAADFVADNVVANLKALSREQEEKADVLGLTYATRAGYDASGAVRAVETLSRSHTGELPKTHRSSEERIALLTKEAGKYDEGQAGYDRWQEFLLLHLESGKLQGAPAETP